jgi:hypothetical protein
MSSPNSWDALEETTHMDRLVLDEELETKIWLMLPGDFVIPGGARIGPSLYLRAGRRMFHAPIRSALGRCQVLLAGLILNQSGAGVMKPDRCGDGLPGPSKGEDLSGKTIREKISKPWHLA